MFFLEEQLHIGIIMDGNGRWAKQRFMPRLEGHRRGAQNLRNIVEHSSIIGIKYLTVFAFSTENWNRSSQEINDLMNLLRFYLKHEVEFFNKHNVKLNVIGSLEKLPRDIEHKINEAINLTGNNDGLTLSIALNYGGKEEIFNAAQLLAQAYKNNEIELSSINENNFHQFMYSRNLPMMDVLIRTSGEQRISNFMLWHAAYAELFFTQTLWPDFTCQELENIIEQYKHRERRFGGRLVYDEY